MKRYKIRLAAPLGSARIRRPKSAEQIAAEDRARAMEMLESISEHVAKIESELNGQLQAFQERVSETAIRVAQTVLRSDADLVDHQIHEFIDQGIKSLPKFSVTAIYIHPSCGQAVIDWVQESDLEDLQVFGDATLAPGDCRIEAGERGVLLEAETLMQSLLQQLNREPAPEEMEATA